MAKQPPLAHLRPAWIRYAPRQRPTDCCLFRFRRLTRSFLSCNAHHTQAGWVAEWFKAAVLKTAEGASSPWVRIPPHPPKINDLADFSSRHPGNLSILGPRLGQTGTGIAE